MWKWMRSIDVNVDVGENALTKTPKEIWMQRYEFGEKTCEWKTEWGLWGKRESAGKPLSLRALMRGDDDDDQAHVMAL